ncbi:hypothetical protein WJX72_000041 [[Myrmecia] bisecta]|uniref:Uncharacterized protein n=1 Tax=[Myrmecia] bisecta TaxID=41462 RepID=A0AAW1QNJ8_9CHLO
MEGGDNDLYLHVLALLRPLLRAASGWMELSAAQPTRPLEERSSFATGSYQLIAQMMTAIEVNAREERYCDISQGVEMTGILTCLTSFLFVRFVATLDANKPGQIARVEMQHSNALSLFNFDGSINQGQSLAVVQLLCSLLLPRATAWTPQEWQQAMQATVQRAKARAGQRVGPVCELEQLRVDGLPANPNLGAAPVKSL